MNRHALAYTRKSDFMVDYGREVEQEIVIIQQKLESYPALLKEFPMRWMAIKLLEEDEEIGDHVRAVEGYEEIFALVNERLDHLRKIYGDDADTIFADRRYGWINGLTHEVLVQTRGNRLQTSDLIDRFVTHRYLGFLIFGFLMWVVFKFSTDIATPYIDWIEAVIAGPITNWTIAILNLFNLGGSWVESFLLDGVIAGVGGVLVFVPVLFFLYLLLAFLEDSGYMARAAFLMDKVMHVLGLHGKSFLPMVLGFGCSVPAFYGTRTLKSQRDRILTSLLVPFMSCSAKLPVYVIFAAIFFPDNTGLVVFLLYTIGVLTALVLGLLLKNTLFKQKKASPFVMELPPYRMPTIKSIWIHTWERTSAFVQKAWTVILGASVVIWLLLAIPTNGGGFAQTPVEDSAFAVVSGVIAPALKPAGFGTWEAAGALTTGVFSKEIIISTFAQIFNLGANGQAAVSQGFFVELGQIVTGFLQATWDTVRSIPLVVGINVFENAPAEQSALSQALANSFTAASGGHPQLAGFSFLIFVLYYTPCLVALNAERQELGWKWMLFTALGQLIFAWIISVIVFQAGLLFGLG
ncbi:MAG: ferrous iron transport protein B [Anaerolineaceae bacterium]|nr:ferrous iron transport protein B [Anaerolineaceae bacterium]